MVLFGFHFDRVRHFWVMENRLKPNWNFSFFVSMLGFLFQANNRVELFNLGSLKYQCFSCPMFPPTNCNQRHYLKWKFCLRIKKTSKWVWSNFRCLAKALNGPTRSKLLTKAIAGAWHISTTTSCNYLDVALSRWRMNVSLLCCFCLNQATTHSMKIAKSYPSV